MDENEILIYLFFYDDGARIWDTGDRVGSRERTFIEAVVDRFEHHRNLIWVVGEESEEAYSTERVQRMARAIQQADDHGHLVGNHHHSGTTFKSWRSGGALNHYAMQLTAAGKKAHAGAVGAFRKAEGKYQVIYSESTATDPNARHAWACAMGGLMPMLLKMDIASTPHEELSRCRSLQTFFEATDFYTMRPHDELAAAGTQWVLADPGRSYIAYAEHLEGDIGLKKLVGGRYRLRWLDCSTGIKKTAATVSLPAGTGTFRRPAGIGRWCAVWITRAPERDTQPE